MLRARWQDFWPRLTKAQGGVLIELFAGEPKAPKRKTGTCAGRSTQLIEILKAESNLSSFPIPSRFLHLCKNSSPVKTGDLSRLFSRCGSLNSRRCIRLYRSCWRLLFFRSIPMRESSNSHREFRLDRPSEDAFPRGDRGIIGHCEKGVDACLGGN